MLFFTGSITLHMSRHTDRQTDRQTQRSVLLLYQLEKRILKYWMISLQQKTYITVLHCTTILLISLQQKTYITVLHCTTILSYKACLCS